MDPPEELFCARISIQYSIGKHLRSTDKCKKNSLPPKDAKCIKVVHNNGRFKVDAMSKLKDPGVKGTSDFKRLYQCAVSVEKAMDGLFELISALSFQNAEFCSIL